MLMNLYTFRFLVPKEKRGKAFQFVDQLKTAATFKRARFDVYIPSKNTEKVIVCLGQKHTVLRGKMSKWGAKHIGRVQARLFTYYRYFHHKFGVMAFGAEGVIAQGKGLQYKYQDQDLNAVLAPKEREQLESEDEAVHEETVQRILKRLSVLWFKKLKTHGHNLSHGKEEIAPYAAVVNGLRLYSYVAEQVTYFPIEGESAYQRVARDVNKMQEEMIKMKKNPHYKQAITKKGKGLTQEEYDALMQYNDYVKKFNKAIKSTYREEASLALSLEELQSTDLVVFTMGIGHRHNYKWLVPRYLKSKNTAFILITAPELWWWKHVVVSAMWLSLLVALVGGGLWLWLR